MDATIIAAVAIAFYIAWNIGANDSANAMGTAVGAGLLSFRQATLTIAIFVMLGAYLKGYKVMKTIGKGIIPPEYLTLNIAIIALLAAGIWVTIATIKGLPVSTTQAIVGGVVGVGIAIRAPINWGTLIKIAGAWVCSPILAAIFALILFKFYGQVVNNIKSFGRIELLYKWLAVLGGSYMAFNFGVNEVANATGLLVGAGFFSPKAAGMFGAISLAIGSLTFSYAVMYTVGKKITSLGPLSAFSAQFGSAIAVSLANMFGLPVSSSQAIVGGVIGVGLATGRKVGKKVVGEIVFGWVATPTISIVLALGIFKLFQLSGLI
ncbi:inorganic phosphate transporter [Thermococcus bergensis]|jgi:PiT family inorganic phosphate transporter|uniref:inorganic phosphate transporter n=1 Tax=Thermococcus bergensis TaxID=2689387 RepID=UPI001CEDA8E0|nr:inorganic phosphate transporter [Thermococcus bergensis]MCA6214327.1 inorganic phosphate transporter [Thermococcus bergensis]